MADTSVMDELLEVDGATGAGQQLDPVPNASHQQPDKKNPEQEEIARLQRELKTERRSRSEFQKAAEFWTRQAQSGPAKPAATPEPEAPKVTVDLVDALTTGDHTAIAKAMREMGFVSKHEVQAEIAATRSQITAESQLLNKYPDLADDQSEFFKLTGTIYNELASDPAMAKSGKLVEVAARMAKGELGGSTSRRTPAPLSDDDPDEDPEEDRARRVSRQSGDRGRHSTRQGNDGESEVLSAMQKSIVQRLRNAGADITEESYAKRAKAGVRMGGLPTTRRAK